MLDGTNLPVSEKVDFERYSEHSQNVQAEQREPESQLLYILVKSVKNGTSEFY